MQMRHSRMGQSPAAGGQKANMGSIRRLLHYMAPYRKGFIFVIIGAMLGTLFGVLAPAVLGMATTELFEGSQRGAIDMGRIAVILSGLGLLYVAEAFFNYLTSYIMAGVSQKTLFDLREAIQNKMARLPLNYYDTKPFGDILSRVTNDVDTINNSLQQAVTQIVTSVTKVIGILVMMLVLSPILTLIGLISLPLSAFVSTRVARKAQPLFAGQQNALGAVNGNIEEVYSGHLVVKAFNHEKEATEAFNKINDGLYEYGWKSQFVSGLLMPLVNFFGNLGYVGVAVTGSLMALSSGFAVGKIQSFIQYMRQFNQPISQAANLATVMQSAAAACDRIFTFLDEREETPDPDHPHNLDHVEGNVEFDHVQFGYVPEKTLIRDLDVHIRAGQKVAIVGPTGAGKTTLINLLMRFYDVTGGAIRIDGVDIRDMERDRLRDLFGMVLQDTWLFGGTIMENLRYGRLDATDEEIYAAAKAAHVHHFITTLADGYHTVLNEESSNISQGQKQLLTIARAILSDPAILILDEATSSVDTRTEILIQKAMENLTRGRTSFVIAHRLSTIRDSDMIFVMNQGDIIEQGTHDELLAKGGFYYELYNSQFAGPQQEPEDA